LKKGGTISNLEKTRTVAAFTPVARSSLAMEVAKKLRREILVGHIKPGERILEQEISAVMRTSRGPVRDALIRLEHEGLIVREPNHSAVVASMTIDDVEEVCSLRLSLELLALRYSIERSQEEDFKKLEEVTESLCRCLQFRFTLQEAVDLDLQFHEEIVKTARHNRVLSMWQSIKPQIWFLIYSRNAYEFRNFEEAVVTHRELVEAIRARDSAKGQEIVQTHLNIAYANLISIFTKIHSVEEEVS
jgi:DNA-binding GntR family transcriptional regulator